MSRKIDRAALLKGGGISALATVLLGASRPGKQFQCCEPIDLTFQIGARVKRKKRQNLTCAPFNAIRLITRKHEGTQPSMKGWQSMGIMLAAQLLGDEPFGKKALKQDMGYDLWVYVQ